MTSSDLTRDKFNIIVEDKSHITILKERDEYINKRSLNFLQIIDPITLTYNVNNISFNTFGCWNSIGNNTLGILDSFRNTKSLPILADMIQKFKGNFNPSFTIIAGDNFYSDNDQNVKNNIDVGFDILGKLNIPHFLLLGNHDIETNKSIFYEIKKTFDDVVLDTSPMIFGKWILPGANYLIKIKAPYTICHFLMVDTNIFVEDEYYTIQGNKSGIQKYILKWIDITLTSVKTIGPVFVVGHHPLYAFGHRARVPLIHNPELDKLYELLIKHNIKFYLCADEHNFQYIYDATNDIHHIIAGGSSSGDESFTFIHNQIPFDSRGIKLNISNTNLYGRMIINSPHFVNINVNDTKIDIKVVSLSLNQYHSIDYLKTNCNTISSLDNISESSNSVEFYRNYYKIVYNFTIPKHIDYIYISNCKNYIKRIEKELSDIKKKRKFISIIGGSQLNKIDNKKRLKVYKFR